MVSTSKLEEINSPIHLLPCKPSRKHFVWANLNGDKAKQIWDQVENTLWIGGRKSRAAPASCVKLPTVQASEGSFIFFSAKSTLFI